jgi:hypothetical protein
MGHDFLVEMTGAHDEDLSEVAVLNQVVLDELLELSIGIFALELHDLNNRKDLAILDEKFLKAEIETPESFFFLLTYSSPLHKVSFQSF